ncbi:MAG: DUF560 domain-containing protein [Rhodospirillaceae bacterium]|nr:DUF560 domain-containing protein [Rhodospirillaceae bacterium]
MMIRIALITSLLAITASQAFGNDADQSLEKARTALLSGDTATAERELAQSQGASDINDYDFLRGTLAVQQKDYDTAIAAFRAMLSRDPTLNRVRLDLAQAYYLKGDDIAATYHFRAAVAQGLPPEVAANVTKYLEDIRRRKRWDASMSLALAPDTNINAATTADSVTLFGLPFVLDPAAQKKSGIGVTGSAAGSYRFVVSDNVRLKMGAAGYATEYGNADYSDRNISANIGPVFVRGGDDEVGISAIASRRWFGGKGFTQSMGVRIEGQKTLSPRWMWSAGASWENRDYDAAQYDDYDGRVYTGYTSLTYALDAASLLQGSAALVREHTNLDALRAWQYIGGVNYYRENLWQRFAVGVGVQPALIRYDAPLLVFGKTRRDTQVDYRISLSNAYIDWWGFTPVVSYVHSDRYSNINLYTYHRDRGEIGIRRNF